MILTNKIIRELKLWSTLPRLEHRARQVLGDTDVKDKRILENGCGRGAFLMWCWANGAERCFGLEPEANGSTAGTTDIFEKAIKYFRCEEKVELFRGRLSELSSQVEDNFDVVILYNVINHIDEQACILLKHDESSRIKYRTIFLQIRQFLNPKGRLIIADCAQNNLFYDLGLLNPFASNIEWNKHQNPSLWKQILLSANFQPIDLRWYQLYPLKVFGRIFANRYFSYITFSHFILESVRIESGLHHR